MAAVRGPAAGTPWLDRLFPWLLGLVSVAVVLAEDKGGARTLSNSLSPLEGLAPVAPDPVTPSWLSGSWGPWSPWSECSRSCGTGVAVQTRECRRRVRAVNKKKDKKKHRKRSERSKHESDARRRKSRVLSTQCVGQYKRVHVCNEQECPRGSLDFRALQCEAHNKHNYSGHFYQWEPFLAAPDPCQLNCRAKGFRFYATLNQSVVDGTACLPKVTEPAPLLAARRSRWLCVSGICQRVGCDGVVGSSARLDGCGVCGGDNSTCRTVSGIFTRPQLPQGFNVIAVLPQGACNVTIAQLKPTINLLSVRRLGGSPVLHGGGRPSWPGVYEAAGTRFTYTQADPVRGVAETLSAPGPLSKPTELLLMYQQPNPGIKYEYSVPLPRREFGAAGAPPTALAAPLPPLLTTTPAPEERNDGDNEVADGFPFGQAGGQDVPAMDAADAPPKGGKGRRFMWKVTGYSECSKSCGGGIRWWRVVTRRVVVAGVQEAQVHCVRHNSLLPVSPYRCAGQEKPYEFLVPKTCSTRPCPAEWVTGDWSGCSVTCGSGTQTREQSCRQEISTSLAVRVADGACLGARPECSAECGRGVRSRTVSCPERPDGATCAPGEQPASQEACDAGPCASIASAPAGALSWLASEWSTHCSAECGTGVQSRSVVCSAAASKCDPRHRPAHTRACSSEGASCRGQWFASPWGPCSATCGQGAQTRGVACLQWQRGEARLEVRDDDFCDPRQKPEPQQPCAERACPPHWYAGEWSECSQSCGTGAQKREVRCIGPGGPSTACSEAAKLPSRKACHLQACSSAQSPPETQDDPADSGVPCEDRLRNCHLVVQARLCKYSYYGSSCCSSCRRKGD
ncbi:ADAMTS-like protein 4 [Thrips palmi]|uniref:ADAMTS-like protein 4 n=1 Tax=Thrips palmi TaxID=161013 RepID=A0A6P8YSD4_THRPL|nr:ADAMTS-like protein 4 [Thrips palmi]